MFSELAKNDLIALRQQGYSPTDEEVVKLNDLAIRIERGKDTTPANMPRVGFAGNVVLHEPTIGAMEWWHNFGRDAAWTNDGRLETYFFMLAHARNLDYLKTLQHHKDIRNAVKQWKKCIDATHQELWRAMMWVKYGADEVWQEMQDTISNEMNDEEVMDMLWSNVIVAAGALGVMPNDLKTHTQSELVASLIEANIHARIPMKQSIAKEYLAYRQILRQIEERGQKKLEVSNG